jgi:hypothetical protein
MHPLKSFQLLFFTLLITCLLTACGGGGGSGGNPGVNVPPLPGNEDDNDNDLPEPVVSLVQLSLSSIDPILDIEDIRQLTVTGQYSDTSTQNITDQVSWSSGNNDIVRVSSSGLLTALSAGTTSISASFGGLSEQVMLTVRALDKLSLSPGSLILALNSSKAVQVSGIYTDNSVRSLDAQISWASENVGIASVSDSGIVTAHAAGSTEISAEVSGIRRTLPVTVSPATLQSIELSAAGSQVSAGFSLTMTATGLYSDGTQQTLSDQVVWSVSDPALASIDVVSGVLAGLQAGSVVISASKEGLTGTLPFQISPATLSSLQVDPAVLTLVKGTSQAVAVTAVFSDLTKQDVSDQVRWQSSDPARVQVSEAGLQIEALDVGSATLTASLLDQQVSLEVTVSDAELVSLTVWPENTSLPLGVTQQFFAQGRYTDGSIQDLTEQVTWLSSNEASALIMNSENDKGHLESKAVGTTTITAVSGDIQQTTLLSINDTFLSSIEIVPAKQTIARGMNAYLRAIGNYTGGARYDITSLVSWNTISPQLIDLAQSAQGRIKTLESGEALLNAELKGITSLATITISDAALERISIESDSAILAQNSRTRLIARGFFADDTSRDISAHVTWQSSNHSVLSVDNSDQAPGLITGLLPGEASVSASFGQISVAQVFTVTDAQLNSVQISTDVASLNVNSGIVARAQALYSDGRLQDVTAQVNWQSSEVNIASIANTGTEKGRISALSQGEVQIIASLNGIQSNRLDLLVTANPNQPASLNVQVQPNVIINNSMDSSQIQIEVMPALPNGIIVDGTPVSVTITEGETERTEILGTVNGRAGLTLTSAYEGIIGISVSQEGLSANAALLSAPDFRQAIATRGYGQVTYEDEKLKTGSIFLMSMRNLTNREFDIGEVRIQFRDPLKADRLRQFPESPFSEPSFISDGDLVAGEFTYIGYELDYDIQARIYQIVYYLSADITGAAFTLGLEFDFGQ